MTRSSKFYALLILLISSCIFIRLGSSSLLDYDEGIYAQVSRQILQNNDWLTFTFGTNLWFEKPPLFIWTTALLFKLFTVSEFWARAISALSGVLVILLSYMIGSAVFNKRVGLLTVIPLLTGYEFLRQARNGTTDMTLTLFIIMILAVYILYPRKIPAYWYLLSVLFSLGFMVKFWAILVVIIAIGINLVLEKKVRDTFSDKHFWGAIFVAILLIAPWHIIMYSLHGKVFIDRYILYDLVRRTANPLEGNTGTARYYFDRMAYDYSPWFFLLPVALTSELRRVLDNRDRTGLLLVLAACLFVIYSLFVGTKIFHYLTPIYPILAILNANLIIEAYDDYRSTAFSGLVIASLIAVIVPSTKTIVVFLLLAGSITLALFTVNYLRPQVKTVIDFLDQKRSKLLRRINDVVGYLLEYSETLLGQKSYPKLAVLIMCLFLSSIGAVRSRHLYEVIESPIEKIASIAGESNVLYDETIISIALPPDYVDGIGPAAMFYSKRPMEIAWSKEALFILTAENPREIIMGEGYVDVLSDEYEFSVLAKSGPFVYGVIWRRENQP